MARTPDDATRFTATGPYAGTRLNFGASAPNGETPQQKIARLRAAAALARRGHETTFDKAVRIGRIWADRAHRFTALSLIGLTVVAGAVATAGITDMLLHNRRRRNEWLAEQQAKTARDLAEAKRAEARGVATEDQVLLINRERAATEAEDARRNRPGMFKRATSWAFGGLAIEEQKGGRLGAAAATRDAVSSLPAIPAGSSEEPDRHIFQAVEDKLDASRRQAESMIELSRPLGGPLDQRAQSAAEALTASSKSWTGWITGR